MPRSRPRPEPEALPEQLRRAIADAGLSGYALAQLAGDVDRVQIARFLAGQRDLTLRTAGRLCAALGLELCRRKGHRTPWA